MIINYDRNAALSTDEKLQSLVNTLQLAFNEVMDETDKLKKEIEVLRKKVEGDE